MSNYDVIIVGLGAMGSASAFHLAAAGARVLGLDRLTPPHDQGSSHGRTRIIREAYFEHPLYVPLVQRAYELWADLEKKYGQQLLLKTGGVMIGPPDGALVSGAKASALQHQLAHELFSAVELRSRFPVFAPAENMVGLWEPRAGVLFPERAVQAHLEQAARAGATFIFDEPVTRWEAKSDTVRVFTAKRAFSANKLLISAGAWLGPLTPGLSLPLKVERQVLYWFEPISQSEKFKQCPIHIWEYEAGRYFYGFPDLGDGVKLAVHHQGQTTDPDHVNREVSAEEIQTMRMLAQQFLPAANGRLNSTEVCIYTNTPDEHFILDFHPAHPRVLIASPCSGHGFKFSSVIGELAARMLTGQSAEFDLGLFGLARFGRK